jgi:hypothetical protein
LNNIARLDAAERAQVFAETADRRGLPDAIIEKDFWVCWMLKQLFSIEALSGRLLFKGGTSLSKVFHAINRFSEDIDLAVDYEALGFIGANDPRHDNISKSRRTTILAKMMSACRRYVGGEFLDLLTTRCLEVLGASEFVAWNLDVSEQDPNVVRFRYPTASTKSLSYVAPQVLLELGTHAEFVPRDRFRIRSFVGEEFPRLIPEGDVDVVALLAKRTFWEKLTILHAEYHRPPNKPLPDRHSRHYYDAAMMAQCPIRTEALSDMELLDQVVKHKETFYPAAWARYDLATAGSLRLVPAKERLVALAKDYRNMGVMIFGGPPRFATIVEVLAGLEEEINK